MLRFFRKLCLRAIMRKNEKFIKKNMPFIGMRSRYSDEEYSGGGKTTVISDMARAALSVYAKEIKDQSPADGMLYTNYALRVQDFER